MNINDLYSPINLNQDLKANADQFLRAPTNFAPANTSFSAMVANPMLFAGGGGNVIDPMQARDAAGSAYLGERNQAASTNMATKASFADLLANTGSNLGSLQAAMQQLKALQVQSQGNLLQQGVGLL